MNQRPKCKSENYKNFKRKHGKGSDVSLIMMVQVLPLSLPSVYNSKTSITQLCPADQDVNCMSIPKTMEHHQQEVESRLSGKNHCLHFAAMAEPAIPEKLQQGGGPRTTSLLAAVALTTKGTIPPTRSGAAWKPAMLVTAEIPALQLPFPLPYSHSNKACTSVDPKR